ncbi:MAG: hypothetical protein GY714_04410 [Desulfobacterales bacterium]|nr:hypothetical protein [Desulfobacterales bacterium]MCP4163328.1 hypothetical protein [Deltaproteobacteria bacterium]
MADNKYESSLLSQDHIDNLLEDAMKEDTAEDTDSALQDNSDSGLITEDEINMLLDGSSDDDVDVLPVENVADLDQSDDSGLVSQGDIDGLLNGNASEEEDSGLISQGDLDGLLDGNADEGESSDLVSQDDIENLLSGGEETELVSQDDIENLLEEGDADNSSDDQAGLDALINAGDNEDAVESELISQSDIDNLLEGGMGDDDMDRPESEEVPAEEAALPPQDEIGELLDSSDDEDENSLISQGDIDKLLSGDIDDDDGDEESDLISQDDISSLLSTEEDEPAETEESLISQDDINKLMNLDDDFEEPDDLSPEPEADTSDPVDDESIEELLQGDDESDPVILDSPDEKKSWKSKVVALVVILLVISVGTFSYYKFFGEPKPVVTDIPEQIEEVEKEDVVEKPVEEEKIPVEKPFEEEKEDPLVDDEIVFAKMANFIVLTPKEVKDITYISGDLSIEMMSSSLKKIKENKPKYRDIIYRAIKASIAEKGNVKIVKEDLAEELKNRLIEEDLTVENVVFTDFEKG